MTPTHRPADADIDKLIDLAEQRLIAREVRFRRDARALGQHVRAATRPARLLKPVLVALGSAWLLRRASHAGAAAPQAAAPAPAPAARPALFALLAGIPWTRALSHAWPLLPGHWQQRLNPATAASILTLGLPVLEGMLTRRRRHEPARPD